MTSTMASPAGLEAPARPLWTLSLASAGAFLTALGYGSTSAFVDGFVPAMWVASLVPVAGVIAAVFAPREES